MKKIIGYIIIIILISIIALIVFFTINKFQSPLSQDPDICLIASTSCRLENPDIKEYIKKFNRKYDRTNFFEYFNDLRSKC